MRPLRFGQELVEFCRVYHALQGYAHPLSCYAHQLLTQCRRSWHPMLCMSDSQFQATQWWQTGVIYQIYPRSFQDTNGDGVGDLRGIAARLDYLVGLGVDAIWISPFYPSPMADFGYDVADYTNVDPIFGTLEDFDDLLQKAHAIVVDEAPWLFIVHDLNPRALSPKVTGFHPAQSWNQDFTQISMA